MITVSSRVRQVPPIALSDLGFNDRMIPEPARHHLELMLSVAHAKAPLTPVARSLTGEAATVPSLCEVVRDGTLPQLVQALENRFGVALRFSIARNKYFSRSIGGGFVWVPSDDSLPALTLFYSWQLYGLDPLHRERSEPGLSILS